MTAAGCGVEPGAMNGFPTEVEAVLERYFAAELTTFSRTGVPITVALTPIWQAEAGRIMATTGIGLPQKLYNIRRNPKVALLYSDPTGSGLTQRAAVLVQGDATISKITTWDDELAAWYEMAWRKQPNGIGTDVISRRILSWYFQRVKIHVTPRRVLWWPDGDMSAAPKAVMA
ncbi:pyridoxamine 5'-phosphate oxidase family protein [Kribbella sp. NPDC023855]|uniref:pyridoxamine 5'-phosphate oxidase family protein n=1 Tax=Kribbella sp. NPDC023855 TaxID=3154698 RepID=UPI0033EEA05B